MIELGARCYSLQVPSPDTQKPKRQLTPGPMYPDLGKMQDKAEIGVRLKTSEQMFWSSLLVMQ